jgi:diguanylate cyclase (GGDEF)-like protein/PAS domain S-box-containing protein
MLYFFLLRPMALHINERRQAEDALRESEEKYHTLFEQSKDPIYITTTVGEFIDINSSMVDLFHYSREEMMKLNARALYVHSEDRDRFQQQMEKTWTVKDFDAKFHTKDGSEIDCLVTSTVWRDKEGRIIGYQGMIRDITERKQAEMKLKYLSTHDALTGLYNRTYFEEEMARLERGRKFPVSIVMADVDGLKKVNDTYGHAAGDDLLQRAAEIMKSSFRADDVVARIGGDEFAVFLPYTDASSVDFVLARVKTSIENHNKAFKKDPLSLSFGVATCEKGERLANVLNDADRYMYQNKLARKENG